MNQVVRIAGFLVFILSCVVGWPQTTPVSREQIVESVRSGLIGTPLEVVQFSVEQLKLPGTISARGHAHLRLLDFNVDGKAHTIDARMGCEKNECMPFYATITGVSLPSEIKEKRIRWKSGSGLNQSVGHAAIIVRQGETASLVVEKVGLRLTVPVICLQAGSFGQVIRTRIVGTNRIADARVAGVGQLVSITGAWGRE